ncbi:MAG: hypothetical protein ACHRXM_11535 [Isosphaerales bacterium]
MFMDLETFARGVLERSPSVALVTWKRISALRSFIDHVGHALRQSRSDTLVFKLPVAQLDRRTFSEKLLELVSRRDAGRICLLIYEIEPLAGTVGRILNGYRERLASFRGMVVAVRANRQRDFFLECPDLLDWIGTMTGRAEDLGTPLTLRRVTEAIRRFEESHGISSAEFVNRHKTRDRNDFSDAWQLEELIAIKSELEKARGT